MNSNTHWWQSVIAILALGLLFSLPAFYNGFPIVYSDSGTYIYYSHSLEIPIDRPIGYSVFIRAVTWQASNWPTILAQGFLLGALIVAYFKKTRRFTLAMVVAAGMVLTVCSSLAWYTSQIMPDIFASTLVLVVFLFLEMKKLRFWPVAGLLLVFFLCNVTHLSHIFLSLAILLVLVIWTLIRKSPRDLKKERIVKISLLGVAVLTSVLLLATSNALSGHGFRLSLTSKLFLTARLAESGVLKDWLDEECPHLNLVLCAKKEELPPTQDGFLWNEDSPIKQLGLSFWQADSAFSDIPGAILSQPKFLLPFAWDSFKNTGRQLFRVGLQDGPGYVFGEGSAPWYAIRARPEVSSYLSSRQNTSGLKFEVLNLVNLVALLLSLAVVFWTWVRGGLPSILKRWFLLVVLAYVVNAAIAGSLSTVTDRYQARVSWLIVLAGITCVPFAMKGRPKEAMAD